MESEAPKLGAGRRVLVVDDDPLGRKLVGLLLKGAGFGVETAATAEEAARMAAASPPDAIVSDVRMPGTDGFRLCQMIRREARLGRIPFLLLSSEALEEPEQRLALSLGASGVFVRTPNLGDLIAELARALRDAE